MVILPFLNIGTICGCYRLSCVLAHDRRTFRAIERDDSSEVLEFHMMDDVAVAKKQSEPIDSQPPIINKDKMIYYCGFNQTYRDLRDVSLIDSSSCCFRFHAF